MLHLGVIQLAGTEYRNAATTCRHHGLDSAACQRHDAVSTVGSACCSSQA
jgi:hypothetical protein